MSQLECSSRACRGYRLELLQVVSNCDIGHMCRVRWTRSWCHPTTSMDTPESARTPTVYLQLHLCSNPAPVLPDLPIYHLVALSALLRSAPCSGQRLSNFCSMALKQPLPICNTISMSSKRAQVDTFKSNQLLGALQSLSLALHSKHLQRRSNPGMPRQTLATFLPPNKHRIISHRLALGSQLCSSYTEELPP